MKKTPFAGGEERKFLKSNRWKADPNGPLLSGDLFGHEDNKKKIGK
jgi:hypothetical protein